MLPGLNFSLIILICGQSNLQRQIQLLLGEEDVASHLKPLQEDRPLDQHVVCTYCGCWLGKAGMSHVPLGFSTVAPFGPPPQGHFEHSLELLRSWPSLYLAGLSASGGPGICPSRVVGGMIFSFQLCPGAHPNSLWLYPSNAVRHSACLD